MQSVLLLTKISNDEGTPRMPLEKIKREFVKFMEENRRGEPYPRNFLGCLVSILVEPEPISQERIEEITGYSRTTIILTLQRIQLLFPIRKVRKQGDRKNYYEYDGSPERFILDLWQKRIEAQALDIEQIEAMRTRIEGKSVTNPAYKRFFDYLNNMHLYLSLIHSLRKTSVEAFNAFIDAESFDDLHLHELSVLEKGELADFLDYLKGVSIKSDLSCLDKRTLKEYLLLRNEYFTGIKANLNPLYSQSVANQTMVLHCVLIEGSITQEQIEESTLLPRSTISEILTPIVKIGLIKVSKKTGSRIKWYSPTMSFAELMLSYFDVIGNQVSEAKPHISNFASRVRKLRSRSRNVKKVIEVLEKFEMAYLFTLKLSESLKVEMVQRLKNAYDDGFEFI